MTILKNTSHVIPYVWLQQLAGLLPLSALIEFIELPMKIHLYQLSGSVPLWNWPITPAGARTLMHELDDHQSCCLDRAVHSAPLHCIDGRHGDFYPSSAPTTVRLCVAAHPAISTVPNQCINTKDPTARKQSLEVIVLQRRTPSMQQPCLPADDKPLNWLRRLPWSKYYIFSALGWLLFISAITSGVLFRLFFAVAYLILMLVTGLLVRITLGGQARRLLDDRPSAYNRMVVATDSLNDAKWMMFYGESSLVNSFLNRPLVSADAFINASAPVVLRISLRLAILGQWVVAVGSCALQDWNAILISVWVIFCAFGDGYVYPSQRHAKDWLRQGCGLKIDRICATFSSRRSMLAAMVALNPDTVENHTSWINPILASASNDRREWEAALLEALNVEKPPADAFGSRYWWKFIKEGLHMGESIKITIQNCLKQPV